MRNKTVQRFVAAVGVPLALTAITACSQAEYEKPISTTIPNIERTLSDEVLIKQEVQRLGINYSASEQKLWPIFQSDTSSMNNEQKIKEAQTKAGTAIINMQKSENPYFRQAAQDFKQLFREGSLSIRVVSTPLIIPSEKTIVAMGTDIEIRNGKLHRLIVVDANLVLENPHLIEIALQFTHEIQHTKNSIEFEKSLSPSLSVDQKLSLELQRPRNQNTLVLEEADAHGVEAQAYIYAHGLGFYQKPKLQYHMLAGLFIKSDADPEGQVWKKAVAQELLGIKNWQPKGN